MICMASASYSGGNDPDTEHYTLVNFKSWLRNHLKYIKGVEPPDDIMSYVNEIKSGYIPDGDCDCLSSFLLSLARAAGMPAREITGGAVIAKGNGFWKHSWVEAYYESGWQIWDPAWDMYYMTDYTGFIDYHVEEGDLTSLFILWFCNDELGKDRFDYWGLSETSLTATLSCPANLHAYDSQGRHVGLNEQGGTDLKIPNSYYFGPDVEPEGIVIFNQSENIIFEVGALDEGEFNLTLTQSTATKTTMVTYMDISITETTEAMVDVSEENPTYTMEIDDDGDGTPEHTTPPDSIEVIPTCPYDHDGDGIVEDDIDDLVMATDAYLGFNT